MEGVLLDSPHINTAIIYQRPFTFFLFSKKKKKKKKVGVQRLGEDQDRELRSCTGIPGKLW